jgi:[acyl-carrier-protein] S-malonyltransferase
MRRAALVFPGRGSYTGSSLGSLPPGNALVQRVEEMRKAYDLPALVALDGAAHFDPKLHLRPANASPLTFLASLLDLAAAPDDVEPVVAIGNSMGWYTALTATGVLSLEEGYRLVQEMSILQQEPLPSGGPGGQVIYPLTGPDWRPDPDLAASVNAALRQGDGEVHPSVDLGGYAVLAGSESGVVRLMELLPPARVGDRSYPLRLALHGPYHTPLVSHVARAARDRLADLRWRAPEIALVDGRGVRWSPWSTDPVALRDYTLGEQVTTPFGFAASLRVALREWAPDILMLPGPGNSLGGICGRGIVAEGYRGIHDRADFEAAQEQELVILSLRR